MQRVLKLHPRDNVAVAISPLAAGECFGDVILVSSIPGGHKFALCPISTGTEIRKFGFPIGVARCDIATGEHVHEHNTATALENQGWGVWSPPATPLTSTAPASEVTFSGFSRAEGRVAIRNEVWIINTVACINQTASRLAERANRELLPQFPNLDGFFSFPHPFGCSQLGDDLSTTQKILAGLINHPHSGGVLLLGLGCENNRMVEQLKEVHPEKLACLEYFNTQQVADEIDSGMQALKRLGQLADRTRTTVPVNRIVLGMKCGGSDGYSGITANPLLGMIADRHCRMGGTVLLTEVPEMFGAEEVLAQRCESREIHQQLQNMIDGFKDYFRCHDQPISENPSPGNREGGITTLDEKSLGCVQKAGTTSLIRQILGYGETATPVLGGIALVNGPGNDGVSITALAAAGANMILFTTGRGTPMGAPVPTLKVASNPELAQQKPAWIDFNAGRLLVDSLSAEALADELYEQILQTASGTRQTQNERNGYREIAIWKTGVTL